MLAVSVLALAAAPRAREIPLALLSREGPPADPVTSLALPPSPLRTTAVAERLNSDAQPESTPQAIRRVGSGPDITLFLAMNTQGAEILTSLADELCVSQAQLAGRSVLLVALPSLGASSSPKACRLALSTVLPGQATERLSDAFQGLLHLINEKPPSKAILLRTQLDRIEYSGDAESLAFSFSLDLRRGVRKRPVERPVRSLEAWLGQSLGIPTLSLGCPTEASASERKALVLALKRLLSPPNPTHLQRFEELARKAQGQPWFLAVDEQRQTLALFRQGHLEGRFSVATGIAGCTPEGRFRIIDKERNVRTEEGRVLERRLKPDLGSFWMGIDCRHEVTGVPFGLHGTDQPETLGQAASRGCVRLRDEDLATFFFDIPVGTEVEIY